jgi:8-oxo-dGTP diphosphatase
MAPKLFVATKAFIEHEGKVLILRESSKYSDGTHAAEYDVPGGRMETGQKFDESLLREIKEETGLEVEIGKPFFVSEWRPTVRGEEWQIVGISFVCKANSAEVILSKDHDDYQWIEPNEYRKYNIIPNFIPAFEAYLAQLKGNETV